MAGSSLQDKLSKQGGAFEMLYDAPGAVFQFPVQSEFANWRDEQDAWRTSVIFQNMSHHMCNVYFEGPDVLKLLSDFGINSFKGYGPMQAKQYVSCNAEGQYIGDAILTCEEENKVCIVGKPTVANWLAFQISKGGYDAKVVLFDPPSPDLAKRSVFRFQVQGPNAEKVMEKVNGGALPEIPFFHMGKFNVGPHEVVVLNHRMSGAPGYEFWGPSEVGEDVRRLILEAGEEFDIQRIGGLLYPITATESGWVGSAIPAIYSGASTEEFRRWLPADGFEANAAIGGSSCRGDMEELYLNPYELGYGFMVKFDHPFCGDEALKAISQRPKRKKVRVVWNADDATEIHRSMFGDGDPYKYMSMPNANYCTFPMDEVTHEGRRVGVAFYPIYSRAARGWISLAAVDEDLAKNQQELVVTWGEPNGGSRKPSVERHQQKQVRVTVDAKPIKRD
jgi:vanillate/3-O-methylgallate O-demethylase